MPDLPTPLDAHGPHDWGSAMRRHSGRCSVPPVTQQEGAARLCAAATRLGGPILNASGKTPTVHRPDSLGDILFTLRAHTPPDGREPESAATCSHVSSMYAFREQHVRTGTHCNGR